MKTTLMDFVGQVTAAIPTAVVASISLGGATLVIEGKRVGICGPQAGHDWRRRAARDVAKILGTA